MYKVSWGKLKNYLTENAWKSTIFWRNQFIWELTFSRIQNARGIKPCPFAADITSHLFAIAASAVPGFMPVNNEVAPVSGFTEVFEEEYKIKYAPIIFGPGYTSVFQENISPAYYSFKYHTSIKLSPKLSNRDSILTTMYHVYSLADKYFYDIKNGDLSISGTALFELSKNLQLTFAHYSDLDFGVSSNDILLEDEQITKYLENCRVKEIPKNSEFMNGCVRITRK